MWSLLACVSYEYTVTVEVAPEVVAEVAEGLPATVVVWFPLGSTQAIGGVCDVPTETTTFTATGKEMGCAAATEIVAWLDVEDPEACGGFDPTNFEEDGYGRLAEGTAIAFAGRTCDDEDPAPGEGDVTITLAVPPPE